ncbi:MAG: sugar ABC transporter permease [Ruminococcaceae bacterium]|nr:sugar ABC transporter permease [Oscillospiraceae bacterium]
MKNKNRNPAPGQHTLLMRVNRNRQLYFMVLPAIVAVFIFHYIPVYGILMAFQNYKPSRGVFGSEFVGLKHFKTFVEYPYFWKIIGNTLSLSLWSFVTTPAPIVLALMLNEMRTTKFKKSIQTILYAPHFVSVVVVCSMVLLFVSRDGIANKIVEFFGGTATDMIGEPKLFVPIYLISGLWSGLGWGTILFTSSLSSVPMETVEAAKVDGASRMRIIWHIYLPHIRPTIATVMIMKMGTLLSIGFEKIFLLQNPLNLEVSSVISTHVYEMGLIGRQWSYSTAVGVFNNAISIILVILANTVVKKLTEKESGLW